MEVGTLLCRAVIHMQIVTERYKITLDMCFWIPALGSLIHMICGCHLRLTYVGMSTHIG